MGGRASVLVEIIICFGGVVRQGICESGFFLKPGGAQAQFVATGKGTCARRTSRSGVLRQTRQIPMAQRVRMCSHPNLEASLNGEVSLARGLLTHRISYC
jgi:hypothetical protein